MYKDTFCYNELKIIYSKLFIISQKITYDKYNKKKLSKIFLNKQQQLAIEKQKKFRVK